MDIIEERDSDLDAHGGVVVLEVRVVVLDVGKFGEAAIFAGEEDLRTPEIACVAERGFAFGAGYRISGVDCRAGDKGGVGQA